MIEQQQTAPPIAEAPISVFGIDNGFEMDLVISVLMLYPMIRIFKRAGLSPYFGVLVMTPYVGLFICFTILTFKKWPHFIGYQQGKVEK